MAVPCTIKMICRPVTKMFTWQIHIVLVVKLESGLRDTCICH